MESILRLVGSRVNKGFEMEVLGKDGGKLGEYSVLLVKLRSILGSCNWIKCFKGLRSDFWI